MMSVNTFMFLLEDVLKNPNADTRYMIVAAYDRALDERNALAAEVERLTAEANTLADQVTELHEAVTELEAANAAPRAQLNAGEGWRRTDKLPRRGLLYEIKATALHDGNQWYIYVGALLAGTVEHNIAIDYRPAPPQE